MAGRLAEAEQIYRHVIAAMPRHAGALHALGALALQAGRPAIADSLLTQAITLKPAAEFQLTRGWLKFVTKAPGPRVRVRTGLGTITASDATVVVHAGDGFEAFVETGTARLSEVGKIELTGGEIKGGGFASRATGKSLETERRPPAPFVAALPRDFMDPLPLRAARFASAHVDPVADHEATFAEAQPWLTGPYRAGFLKRFQSRLDEPAFRDAMATSGKVPPEWSAAAPPPKAEVPPPAPAAKAEPDRTFHWPWEKSSK
jgi:hypothetical protein